MTIILTIKGQSPKKFEAVYRIEETNSNFSKQTTLYWIGPSSSFMRNTWYNHDIQSIVIE